MKQVLIVTMSERETMIEIKSINFSTDKQISEGFVVEIPLVSASNQNRATSTYLKSEEVSK